MSCDMSILLWVEFWPKIMDYSLWLSVIFSINVTIKSKTSIEKFFSC